MGPNFVLLFVLCATGIYAATDIVQANLYVTDSPVGQALGANVTAGETLVADFQLRDVQTNATLGNSLGYCILLRDAGPNQCQYTIQFASGTIQVGHSRTKSAVHANSLLIDVGSAIPGRALSACTYRLPALSPRKTVPLRLLAGAAQNSVCASTSTCRQRDDCFLCRWPASHTPGYNNLTTGLLAITGGHFCRAAPSHIDSVV